MVWSVRFRPVGTNQIRAKMKTYTFTVQTTESKIVKNGRKRTLQHKPLTMQVAMQIEGNVIQLGYGYKTWWTNGREDSFSTLPGRTYKIHNSIMPKEGDVWKYGSRTFVVGKRSGFLCYTAPLYENGRQVATVTFEDYYKD